MNPKKLIIPLLTVLVASMAREWKRIRYELRTVSGVGKILLAFTLGLFVTIALLHALDLLPEFLSIFNINIFI